MKDLCVRLEQCGHFSKVKSYLQSGNVVVQISAESSIRNHSSETAENKADSGDHVDKIDSEKLIQVMNDVLRTHFRCEPVVIVRQIQELEEVLEKIPFEYKEPNKVQVHFLDDVANFGEGRESLEKYDKGPEVVKVFDKEVYVHYVEGIGNSKFNRVPLEKMLKVNATARNLNTIRSVLKIAQSMAID